VQSLGRAIRILRSLAAPLIVVVLAVVLTIPWTWIVLHRAYRKTIVDNAKGLARRIELQVWLTPRPIPPAQLQAARAIRDATHAAERIGRAFWIPMRRGNIDRQIEVLEQIQRAQERRVVQQMREALQAELLSDETVRQVIFFDMAKFNTSFMLSRTPQFSVPGWTIEEVRQRATWGLQTWDLEDRYVIQVPWMQNDRVLGFTYIELSRDAITAQFWAREGELLKQTLLWSGVAAVLLATAGLLAYRAWRRVGAVRQRADLDRHGLMAERGLTAAVLAHEIRNPLGALRFQVHSLLRNADDPQRVRGACETIDAELSRIQELVKNYLDHEKAEALRAGRVDLAEAVRSLRGLMGELLHSKGTLLRIETPAAPVVAVCDPHALRQVLINLVLNAQQAMKGRGTITISVARAEEGFARLSVADTGPGIPEEMRDRLFKPFQTTKKDGSGIGLALVKRFVDNFGGGVSVESPPGGGAVFHLRLPLAEEQSGRGAQAARTGIGVA